MSSSSSSSFLSWSDCWTALQESSRRSRSSSNSSNSNSQQHAAQCWEFEERLAAAPHCYSVTEWGLYLDHLEDWLLLEEEAANQSKKNKNKSSSEITSVASLIRQFRDWTGKRAVTHLPRSYKLWKRQWEFCLKTFHMKQQQTATFSETKETTKQVVACFEQALVTLSQFPRVWMVYLEFLVQQLKRKKANTKTGDAAAAGERSDGDENGDDITITITTLRRTVNRALQALPVTQHEEKLWKPILLPALLLGEGDKDGGGGGDDGDDNPKQQPPSSHQRHNILPLETAACLLQRYCYLKHNGSFVLTYATWCEGHGLFRRAAAAYHQILTTSRIDNDDNDSSLAMVWQAFGDVCSQHAAQVESVGVPWRAVLRTALESSLQSSSRQQSPPSQLQQPHQQQLPTPALIYSWLAAAHVRAGDFDLARSVYEQGLERVSTVRDFSILYTAYSQLEEGLLEHAVAALEEQEEEHAEDENEQGETNAQDDDEDHEDWDILLGTTNTTKTSRSVLADMEWSLARAEHLTQRRPLLLNRCRLRQDFTNLTEWLHRADLYLQQPKAQKGQAVAALRQGLQATAAAAGGGRTSNTSRNSRSDLVLKLVAIYDDDPENDNNNNKPEHKRSQGVAQARELLQQICQPPQLQQQQPAAAAGLQMTNADDLAACWAAWIELELRHEQWDQALSLARQSVAPAASNQNSRHVGRHRRPNLTKSLRLWDLLLDLEESLGTLQTTKDAYNRALEIKAATVQHVLNYAAFLTQHEYFEESFQAYERGVELFGSGGSSSGSSSSSNFAAAKVLWKTYLQQFLQRYKGSKVERTRDLFTRCLEQCPAEDCAEFFMMHGAFEEEHGLVKRALAVYRDMCHRVAPASEKLHAYQLYILKTTRYLGVTATRDIYQEAIQALEDDQSSAKICVEFATMETGLQQMDRARAIFTYGAQMADPRRLAEYWKAWNDFEIAHGNEETFREMLRVKRSVEAAFSTVNYNATGMTENSNKTIISQTEAMKMIASQEGVELEEVVKNAGTAAGPQTAVAGFVSAASGSSSGSKRTATSANLDDVEERVAKLRKATAAAAAAADDDNDDDRQSDDDEISNEEIDIDDIDAEIEQAAAEGAAAAIEQVSTKTVPAAVFGGLAPPDHAAQKGRQPE